MPRDEDWEAAVLRSLDALSQRMEQLAPRVIPEHFTIQQVAKRLNVSTDTVKRWCTYGELPSFKQERIILIRGSELEKFLKKKTRFLPNAGSQ